MLAGPPHPATAQTQSAVIRGSVTDTSGGVVGDARVTLVDHLGYELAAVMTDAAGAFALEAVPLGTYTVRVESATRLSGARSVAVQSALPIVMAIELTPQAAEHVVVHGAAEQPAVASRLTISGDALRTAPARLSSRSLQQMLATLPGWASEDNGLVHVRGVDDGFLYVEDGVPVYDRVDQLFGVAPDPAGIGSLHVMTGYVPAEYGLKSGAVIEIRSAAVPRQRWTGELDAGTGSDSLAAGRAFASGPLGRADLAVNAAGERSDRFLDPVHPDNFHNQGGLRLGWRPGRDRVRPAGSAQPDRQLRRWEFRGAARRGAGGGADRISASRCARARRPGRGSGRGPRRWSRRRRATTVASPPTCATRRPRCRCSPSRIAVTSASASWAASPGSTSATP